MKLKSITKALISMLLIALMLTSLTACGTAVSVNILDGASKTQVETKTGKTIKAILDDAQIAISQKDETEPALDSKLKKGTTEITIKRYAKVSVVKDAETKKVELVGGTVEDAVKKSGFTLSENESPDAELTDFLKDGMTITIAKAITVTLIHDGKSEEIKTKAKTVEALLGEQDITLGKDDELSAKADAALKDGVKITLKRVEYKTETRTEKVKYTTSKENTSSLPSGQTQLKQAGKDGEKEVTYKIKYVDGKKDSEKAVSEKITKNAVNEIILVGTAGGSSSNGGKTVVSKVPTYDCDGSGHGYYTITYSDGSVEYEQF